MRILLSATLALLALASPLRALDVDALAGKKTVFLGDSITQSGLYISYTTYYLNRLHPNKDFDIIGLGLASETLSCLSEEGHAGGKFPRPCLFERLGRLLEKAEPEIVFACYGINDGIYLPLDETRFAVFRDGVTKLIAQCKEAGVKEIILITPPIFDAPPGTDPDYDEVMAAYAAWQVSLEITGVHVIDLHTAMRAARDARDEPFSKDRIHPGDEGHLLMAKTILGGIGVKTPDESPANIAADPLFQKVHQLRQHRSTRWMRHIGYTREKTVAPQPLGDTEKQAASMREEIDALRRAEAGDSAVTPRAAGFRGIWFDLGQESEFGSKYSGGLGTYTANHVPMAHYVEEVNRTYFTWGGTPGAKERRLHIGGDGTWQVTGPTGAGPQAWGCGGEIEMWISTTKEPPGRNNANSRQKNPRNHSYARRPQNAHPDFHTYWADGDADKLSESYLHFTNKVGDKVWRLPYDMTEDFATPTLLDRP